MGRGGGVLLYVHNSLISCECSEWNKYNVVQTVWCQISTGSIYDLYIGVVYKSPSATDSEVKSCILCFVIFRIKILLLLVI
jgi:hypothetical protein